MDSREVSVHDAAAVEALAKHIDGNAFGYIAVVNRDKLVEFILAREAALVEALERIARGAMSTCYAMDEAASALAAHRAASAPKEPTPKYIVGFDPAEPSPGDGACAMIFNKHELAVEAVVRGNITEREAQAMCDALARERQRVTP